MPSSSTKTTKPSQPPKKRRKHSHHQISNPPPSKKPVNPYPRIETQAQSYPTNELPALPCYELTPIMEEYMETLKEFSSGCPKMNVLDSSSSFFTEWRHMLEFEEEDAREVVQQATPALEDIDVWQYINPDAEALA